MAVSKAVSFGGGGSPDAQDYQIQQAQQLAQLLQAQSMQPIEVAPNSRISWTQGLAKMLQGYQAGNERRKVAELLDKKDQSQQQSNAATLGQLLPDHPTLDSLGPEDPAVQLQSGRAMLGPNGVQAAPSAQAQQLGTALNSAYGSEGAGKALAQMLASRMLPPPEQPFELSKGAKRFDARGNLIASNADNGSWERKTRILGNNMAQDYDFNPQTREEKPVGSPYRHSEPTAYGAGGPMAAGDLTPEAVHDAVIDVLADPRRMSQYAGGMGGQKTRTVINNAKASFLKEVGMTEDQVVRQQAIAKSQIKSISDLVGMQNAVSAYETVARGNGDRALELIHKVNSTGIPALNSAKRIGEQQLKGSADAAELIQVLQNYQTEVARIVANPRLVGQLTDTARKEIEGVVPANMTPAQAERVIKRLSFEFDLRNKGIQDSIDTAQTQITPGFGGPAAPAPAAPGKVVKFEDLK
jgi:hypothetical protein